MPVSATAVCAAAVLVGEVVSAIKYDFVVPRAATLTLVSVFPSAGVLNTTVVPPAVKVYAVFALKLTVAPAVNEVV